MTENVRTVGTNVAHRLDEVRQAVASHRNLSDVVRWLSATGSMDALSDVVTQDEFTHDITVLWGGDVFLVFDTT